MAFCGSFSFFLIFLLLCFLSTTTSTLGTVVDIRNDLPNDSTKPPLTINCDQGSSSSNLKQGDHYNQTLTVDEDFECTATWSRWFATWNAYNLERGKGHGTVYWEVKEDGFYHSWDGIRWYLISSITRLQQQYKYRPHQSKGSLPTSSRWHCLWLSSHAKKSS